MAFKKILNVGRSSNDEMFDEKSLLVIQKMDQIVEEILSNLVSLQVLSHGSFGESAEVSQLKNHLLLIVEEQLLPIIDYF